MKIKVFQIFLCFITQIIKVKLENCLLDNCLCTLVDVDYSIICSDAKTVSFNTSFDFGYLLELRFNLKLIGTNNLKLLQNELFMNISLNSLDLSNNQETFERSYCDFNKFEQLKVLNLSLNRIQIIRNSQFSRLNKLEILDLSFNEIFFFEENAFFALDNLVNLNLKTSLDENNSFRLGSIS